MCLKRFYRGFLLIGWISVLTAQNSARTEAIFPLFLKVATSLTPGSPPQFSASDVLATEFEVVNPNSATANVTFQIFDSGGQELLPIGGGEPSFLVGANRIQIGQMFTFSNSVVIGWAKLTSTQPVIAQQEISHRIVVNHPGPPDFNPIVSRINKPPSIAARRGIIRVRFSSGAGISQNTGVSIVYVGAPGTSARGTLVLRSGFGGEKLGETEIALPANGQAAKLFTEWFPSVLSQFPTGISGTLEFSFNQDVFVGAIQADIFGSKEELVEPTSGTLTGSTLVNPSSSTTRSRP